MKKKNDFNLFYYQPAMYLYLPNYMVTVSILGRTDLRKTVSNQYTDIYFFMILTNVWFFSSVDAFHALTEELIEVLTSVNESAASNHNRFDVRKICPEFISQKHLGICILLSVLELLATMSTCVYINSLLKCASNVFTRPKHIILYLIQFDRFLFYQLWNWHWS